MKKTQAVKKPASGGARLKASGRHAQLLGWNPDDWQAILAAAESEKRPATQFVIVHALAAAKKILKSA